MALKLGDRFGRYNLEERLGQGGLAEVWRAVDLSNGRVVALKVFSGHAVSADADRLRAEVELLAAHALHAHPNVVEVYGGGSDPQPHVVMEYLDGGDVAQELAAGPLSLERTLAIGIAVANALDAALRAGITHGDLKPSNILLGGNGSIKLGDFNVARVAGYSGASGSGSVLMSFAYAAPEVWDGRISSASDLYALGCVLFECLTGRPPFSGNNAALFRAHIEATPDLGALPANTPPELRSLIGELLAKDPAARPPDAHAVLIRLNAIRESSAAPALAMPQNFGEWGIESRHPTDIWAYVGRHRQSGKQATIELFFGDAQLGERLRRAVAVNPELVPFGAERLIETNRLLLRPNETLGEEMPPGWIFWVARDEIALPETAVGLTPTAMANAADRLRRLVAAAATVRIDLDVSPQNLVVAPNGTVHVRRPGLVPARVEPEAGALAALRAAAPAQLAGAITSASSLAEAAAAARMAGTRTLRMPGRRPAPADGDGATVLAGAAALPAAAPLVTPGVASAAVIRGQRDARRDQSNRGAPLALALLIALGLLVLAVFAVIFLGRPGTPTATVPAFGAVPTASPSRAPVATFPTTPVPQATLLPLPSVMLPTAAPTLAPVPTVAPETVAPPTDVPVTPVTPAPITPAPITPAPQPTNAPPPAGPRWRTDLTASDRQAENGQLVQFVATTNRNLSGTPYWLQIFNPDTGFVHRQCGQGTLCTVGGRRENVTVRYQSRVSLADGSDVQALSRPISVTWQGSAAPPPPPPPTPTPTPTPPPPQPTPGWRIDLTASDQTAANGELVTFRASANRSVTGTPYVIEIFNPDTGFIHKACPTGSNCQLRGGRNNATARYQARVSLPGGADVQAQSGIVTVTWQ